MRPSPLTAVAVFLACAALAACAQIGPTAAARPAGPAPSGERTAERPNLLIVYTDDHAAHAIGAYGGRLAALDPTPHLDRLAAEGVLFRNSFVTNSICVPARAVVLTGRHSHLTGVRTNSDTLHADQLTFPLLLQAAGYRTALIGKLHLQSDPVGFDDWEILRGQGAYYNPDFITAEGERRTEGYSAALITERALSWLGAQQGAEAPFLLMVQYKSPHRPFEPSAEWLGAFDGPIPEPPTLFDDYAGRTTAMRESAMTVADDLYLHYDLKVTGADSSGNRWIDSYPQRLAERMTPEQRAPWDAAYGPENAAFLAAGLTGDEATRWRYRRYLRDYLRSAAALDAGVGRLLGALDEMGLAENTVVVYASDQGFFLGEHGWFDKRWMYEESLRAPLIVRWPGHTPAGAERTQIVQNLDIAPTLLDLAGLPVPEAMQGLSFRPLLEADAPADWRDAIHYHYYDSPSEHVVPRHEGARTARYKLIHYYEIGEWELFDLARDPSEMRSAYHDPTYADVRAHMEATLDSLRTLYLVE